MGRTLPPVPPPDDRALPPDVLVVGRTGLWFRPPGGERVKLHRRRALRQIVEALVGAREQRADAALPLRRMVEAGWPDEHIQPEAAADRAYAAVATLRKMGLRGWLVRLDEGYALDPAAPLHVVDDEM